MKFEKEETNCASCKNYFVVGKEHFFVSGVRPERNIQMVSEMKSRVGLLKLFERCELLRKTETKNESFLFGVYFSSSNKCSLHICHDRLDLFFWEINVCGVLQFSVFRKISQKNPKNTLNNGFVSDIVFFVGVNSVYQNINRRNLSGSNTKTPLCKLIGTLKLAPFIKAVLENNLPFSMNQICRENVHII